MVQKQILLALYIILNKLILNQLTHGVKFFMKERFQLDHLLFFKPKTLTISIIIFLSHSQKWFIVNLSIVESLNIRHKVTKRQKAWFLVAG